ncbi:MAG: hypothetical protein JNN12_04820 [Bacteroidetes Order II. Incertae sedis bacterium]|nr:hypothetical protein [Bacteroidetes Order II. bacterium]
MKVPPALLVHKVTTFEARTAALEVLGATYRDEKRWIDMAEHQFPLSELHCEQISWFLATEDGQPIGVLRVRYHRLIEEYRKYELELQVPIDVEAFFRQHRIAEIGRFAILPPKRTQIRFALSLIQTATQETVERGFTHYITDVFEDEPNSPYLFHTRVLGFQPVAFHATGELRTHHRRITLLLNIRQAYQRLKTANNRIYRMLCTNWSDRTHALLSSA